MLCRDCNEPTPKNYLICPACAELKEINQYKEKEVRHWDGTTPLYSISTDKYFYDDDDLRDYMEEADIDDESCLMLVICEPIHLSQVDEDYFHDDLPEDGELPDSIAEALEALNKAIRDEPPVSWTPGKYAAIIG